MAQIIFKGSGAPTTTPTKVGLSYVDEAAKIHYKSVGTTSSADWQPQSSGDDQTAVQVPFTPDGDITATDTQAAVVEVRDDTDTKLAGKANSSHSHTLADVTDSGTAASKNVPASGDASATEVVKGDDSRLSDTRTPTAHTHVLADVTDSGTLAAKNTIATGDVDADAVTYSKMQDVSATDRLLGRDSAGAGDVEEIAPAALRTMINVADGSTANDTDANLKNRANHTGTQTKSTISDFAHLLGTHTADTLANLNTILSDATLIDTGDVRLSDSRKCDNTFDTAATARTNLDVYSKGDVDGKVAGLYDHRGAYDASTNTPDLDTSPSGIMKADVYTVSVAGSFFTESVEVGDVLIADQDNPTLLTHWTRVNKNISFGTTAGTACEGDDSRLSDARVPTAHALGGAEHSADTLANLNGKISDATLIDTGDARLSDARTPTAHNHGTADIDNDAITYAKMQNVSATDRILGRDSTGAGDVEEITPAAARTMLNVEDGATTDQSDAEIKTAYENNADTNAFTDADESKLDGIASGATANDTDANLKARANHTGTQTASTISDFDTEVGNHSAVTANTAKVTNATHTGEVTGSTALSVDKTAITGKTLVTTVGADHILIADASDAGNLKKALVSDVLGGGTDAAAIHDDTAAEISAITEKTTPVSADLILIEDSAASNAKKRVQVGNLPAPTPIFGSEYQFAESAGESLTTSTTYVQKLRLTTPSLPAGDYRITWAGMQLSDKASVSVWHKVEVDDTTLLVEPNPQYPSAGQYEAFGGFCTLTLSAATHTIDLDHKTDSGTGIGSRVKYVRMDIWRIS